MPTVLNVSDEWTHDVVCNRCDSYIRFYDADITHVAAQKENYREDGHPAYNTVKCPVCGIKIRI